MADHDERPTCPLASIAVSIVLIGGYTPKKDGWKCSAKCAWYDTAAGRCAVLGHAGAMARGAAHAERQEG